MNLFIYSNLKAKLESKGLDSITSGQIAWFVCSFGLFIIPIVYFHIHFVTFFCMFCIFVLNFFYIKNMLPLLLSIFSTFWLLDYESFLWVSIVFFCFTSIVLLKMRYYRFFWTYIMGAFHLIVMFKVGDTIPFN